MGRDLAAALSKTTMRCNPWVEQDEGPYHVASVPFRSDIVEDRIGTPLRLGMRFVYPGGTQAVVGAHVDVWHCDALGRYSGFASPDGAERGPQVGGTETFLRGVQTTDAAGMCEFRTIFPGWYAGRTVHVHVIVTSEAKSLVSQLFFAEEVIDAVHAGEPYVRRPNRDTTNAADDIFANDGEQGTLDVEADGGGYVATICLAVPGARR